MLTVHAKDSKEAPEAPCDQQQSHVPMTKWEMGRLGPGPVCGCQNDCNSHTCKEDLEGMEALSLVTLDLKSSCRHIHRSTKDLGEQHIEQTKVADPEGVKFAPP